MINPMTRPNQSTEFRGVRRTGLAPRRHICQDTRANPVTVVWEVAADRRSEIGRQIVREVRYLIWLAVGAVLAIVAILIWQQRNERAIVVQPLAIDATIVVDVRGGVATPGVVRLPGGARISDAIAAAGGLAGDADVTRLNLAARLADGQRLVIPTGGQPVAAVSAPATAVAGQSVTTVHPTAPAATPPANIVNLNTASEADLKGLPGIGDVLAGRIVAYREANGPFRTVDQLREVRGVSARLVETLRPLVTVDG